MLDVWGYEEGMAETRGLEGVTYARYETCTLGGKKSVGEKKNRK